MMADVSSGMDLAQIHDEIATLRTKWGSWQNLVDTWMRFLHQPQDYARALDVGTLFQAGTVQRIQERRSSYYSEWVLTARNALHSRLISAPTNILPNVFGETEKDLVMNERLIQLGVGIFNSLDDQMAESYGGYSWDARMKQQITDYGKTAFMVRVSANGSIARVSAPLLSPYSLYHDLDVEPGDRKRVVYEYPVKWADVPALITRYGGIPGTINMTGKVLTDEVLVSDYWLEQDQAVWHSVLIDGKAIRPDIIWPAIGTSSIPIVIVSNPGGSYNYQDTRGNRSAASRGAVDDRVAQHAEPFYSRAISQLRFLQGLESLSADMAALSGLPQYLHRRASTGEVGARPEDRKPFGWIELLEDEQLTVLRDVSTGSFTVDTAIHRILGYLRRFFPDGLVSPDFPTTASGFSVNSQTISLAEVFMTPWTGVAQRAKKMLIRHVIEQHQPMASPFELHGILPEGGEFATKFSSDDYPTKYFDIDVLEPAEIPGQAQQNMNLAERAVASGLVSKRTVRVTRLGINDPVAEGERVMLERVTESQEFLNIKKIEFLQERLEELRAAAKRKRTTVERFFARVRVSFAERALMSFQQQLLGTQQGFTQQGVGGTPPEVNPAENTTENPDEMALGQGRQSSSTQGRPRPPGMP
jgi:hypothetical protein